MGPRIPFSCHWDSALHRGCSGQDGDTALLSEVDAPVKDSHQAAQSEANRWPRAGKVGEEDKDGALGMQSWVTWRSGQGW